ncbi:hypothetical protein RhiJN_14783 [Ceratobasidium sp. AG-Ba]|nr:hypothetical protein RhiJN_14783 [Ceratobasidium sp. AG-Ba]QRW15320.1 hypothetical protein RhiLY_14319 [Ceratobasidium sp. AG-Ba]
MEQTLLKRRSPPLAPRKWLEPSPDEPPVKKMRKSSPRDFVLSGLFMRLLSAVLSIEHAPGHNGAKSSKQNLELDSIPTSSHSKRSIPPSPKWMQARIEQLETELSAANAARDLAVSEKAMAAQYFEAERQARQKALAQKSATEAALSQAEAEQARLLEELQRWQEHGSLDELRSQVQATEATLLEVRNSVNEREELLKKREAELEEARDNIHKIQIKLTQRKQEAKEEITNIQTQLEDLQKELEDTKNVSNKYQMKYQNEKSKRVATKEKLAEYKSRLQLNDSLSEQLRDTAPAALEGLKAVMEAMGLPPLRDQGQLLTPKTEFD